MASLSLSLSLSHSFRCLVIVAFVRVVRTYAPRVVVVVVVIRPIRHRHLVAVPRNAVTQQHASLPPPSHPVPLRRPHCRGESALNGYIINIG